MGAGTFNAVTKIANLAGQAENAGMSLLQIIEQSDVGAKALSTDTYTALGGEASSAIQKFSQMAAGAVDGTEGYNFGQAAILALKGTGLTAAADEVAGLLGAGLSALSNNLDTVGNATSGAFSSAENGLSSAYTSAQADLTSAWEAAEGGTSAAWSSTTSEASSLWDSVTGAASSAWNWTSAKASSAAQSTGNAFSNLWGWMQGGGDGGSEGGGDSASTSSSLK